MQGLQFKICPVCRLQATLDADRCVQCGHIYRTKFPPPAQPSPGNSAPQQPPPQTQAFTPVFVQPPNPADYIYVQPGAHPWVLAGLASLCCITGLGQLVNRQYLKAIVVFIASFMLGLATGGLSVLATWPLSAVDAFIIGQRLHRGEIVGQWQFF